MALQLAAETELSEWRARKISARYPDSVSLALALQTTLNLEDMLKILLNDIRKTVIVDGMVYRNDAMGINLLLEHDSRNSCNYQLELFGNTLGELIFKRSHRFVETEMEILEQMLAVVLHPLHNALQYRRAVEASHHDALTGIQNRSAYNETIQREINRSQHNQSPLGLLVIDIDHFKKINDSCGHAAGDQVLRIVSHHLRDILRLSDRLFRYGGEEFTVVLGDTDADAVAMIAERIRSQLAQLPCSYNNKAIPFTVSIGIGMFQQDDSAESLFNRADTALYRAKSNGRNRVET